MKSYKKYSIALAVLLTATYACKKSVEIPPPASTLVTSSVFSSTKNANAAILGIYTKIGTTMSYQWSLNLGLSGDELINFNQDPAYIQCHTNSLTSDNYLINGMWTDAFKVIFQANSAIEGVNASTALSVPLKNELIGEAKFTRALMYFYLVNLFGNVPLVTSTDYNNNALLARTSADKIYAQITNDLSDASNALPGNYVGLDGLTASQEKIRPNKFAAEALLARVYLCKGKWANAEQAANDVIGIGSYVLDADLNNVFLSNSSEAIWQITKEPLNTTEGFNFILSTVPTNVSLDPVLVGQFSKSDLRAKGWVDSILTTSGTFYFPYKYKVADQSAPVTEYAMVLRLAEQYLVRAEARANQNKISGADGAIADINMIRVRAGLSPYSGPADQASVLAEIMQQRRLELFTEWGHRWLDIKRSGAVDAIMGAATVGKGGQWSSYQQLYPIPKTELTVDPNLTQNSGY